MGRTVRRVGVYVITVFDKRRRLQPESSGGQARDASTKITQLKLCWVGGAVAVSVTVFAVLLVCGLFSDVAEENLALMDQYKFMWGAFVTNSTVEELLLERGHGRTRTFLLQIEKKKRGMIKIRDTPPRPDLTVLPLVLQLQQVFNHNLYWKSLSPYGGGEPTGDLLTAIEAAFGDYATFETTFTSAATGHFGSGWAWLVMYDDGSVDVSILLWFLAVRKRVD